MKKYLLPLVFACVSVAVVEAIWSISGLQTPETFVKVGFVAIVTIALGSARQS